MERFIVEVKLKDVEPIVKNLDQVIPFNPKEAKYFFYKNPPTGKANAGERHVARLLRLRDMKPPGWERIIKLMVELDLTSVLKVEPFSGKPFVVKTSHSEASPKFEAYMSQRMSSIGVGPHFIDGVYSRNVYVLGEECLCKKNGYQPIHVFRDTRIAINDLPELFGTLVGKMHRQQQWTSFDRRSFSGFVWYKERFLNHLYFKPENNDLKLLDFGEVRILKDLIGYDEPTLYQGKDRLPNREKLRNEVRRAAHNLLIGIAYPFVYGVSHRAPGMIKYQQLLDVFCQAYNSQTGFEEHIRLDDILLRTK